jgi:hypothetical protein
VENGMLDILFAGLGLVGFGLLGLYAAFCGRI